LGDDETTSHSAHAQHPSASCMTGLIVANEMFREKGKELVPGQAPRFPTCGVSSNCPKKPSPVALPRGQSKWRTMHRAIDKKLVHFGGLHMAPLVKEKLQQKGGSSGGIISGHVLSPLVQTLTPSPSP